MIRSVLLVVFMGAALVMGQRLDPPLPDAVPFCHMPTEKEKNEYANCTCATVNDGELCKSDEPLPVFCKRACGHAKSCHCCSLKK